MQRLEIYLIFASFAIFSAASFLIPYCNHKTFALIFTASSAIPGVSLDGLKKLIEKRIKEIELQYNKSVVTYVRDFDKFYKAEDNHQNYYQTNFINYLLYKKGCGRENRLEQIWKK